MSFSGSFPGVLGRSLGRVSRVPPGALPGGVREHSESIFPGFRAQTRTETRRELELKLERISRTETRPRTRTRARTRTRTLQVKLGSTRQLEFEPELYFGLQRALGLDLESQASLSFRCTSSQVILVLSEKTGAFSDPPTLLRGLQTAFLSGHEKAATQRARRPSGDNGS